MCPWTELKQQNWICFVGLMIVFCGECLRKSAMLTAGSNFNHIVQNEKAQSHVLVTNGVYSFFRHPSYVGWFYWSIGTQVCDGQIKLNVCWAQIPIVVFEESVVLTEKWYCYCRIKIKLFRHNKNSNQVWNIEQFTQCFKLCVHSRRGAGLQGIKSRYFFFKYSQQHNFEMSFKLAHIVFCFFRS